jgi:hypothetical protein
MERAGMEEKWGRKSQDELKALIDEKKGDKTKYEAKQSEDPEKYVRKAAKAGRQLDFLTDLLRQDRPPPAAKPTKTRAPIDGEGVGAHRPVEWTDETALKVERANMASKWGKRSKEQLAEILEGVRDEKRKYEARLGAAGEDQERIRGKVGKAARREAWLLQKLGLDAGVQYGGNTDAAVAAVATNVSLIDMAE